MKWNQVLFSRATARYLQAMMLGAQIFLSYRLLNLKHKFLGAKGGDDQSTALARLHQKNAQAIHSFCIKRRGYFIKLAQFVASRKDLLPQQYIEVLGHLHDNVPPTDSAMIVAQIEHTLGRPIEQIYKSFDRKPLAAASLAQVHRAVLQDGTAVAVKVQTPGIREVLEGDLAFLRLIGALFKKYFVRKHLETVLEELAASIALELDYKNEIANMMLFHSMFKENEQIVVPAPLPELSGGKVITMTLIEGQPIASYLRQAEEAGDVASIKQVLEVMISAFCQQILEFSFFHADPHPGNFLITSDGRLAILDFGSVQKNTPEITQAYIQLVMAIVSKNKAKSADLLREMGFDTLNGELDTLSEIADIMMAVFQKNSDTEPNAKDPVKRVEALVALIKENPLVKMPDHFVMIGRVFSSVAGLYFHYQPNINLFKIIAPYMALALAQGR